ncbi:hypothetical protein Q5752_001926 [Cryptotrichosporon argae]
MSLLDHSLFPFPSLEDLNLLSPLVSAGQTVPLPIIPPSPTASPAHGAARGTIDPSLIRPPHCDIRETTIDDAASDALASDDNDDDDDDDDDDANIDDMLRDNPLASSSSPHENAHAASSQLHVVAPHFALPTRCDSTLHDYEHDEPHPLDEPYPDFTDGSIASSPTSTQPFFSPLISTSTLTCPTSAESTTLSFRHALPPAFGVYPQPPSSLRQGQSLRRSQSVRHLPTEVLTQVPSQHALLLEHPSSRPRSKSITAYPFKRIKSSPHLGRVPEHRADDVGLGLGLTTGEEADDIDPSLLTESPPLASTMASTASTASTPNMTKQPHSIINGLKPGQKTFPHNLWKVLNDESKSKYIHWIDNGRTVRIPDEYAFVKNAMSSVVTARHFESFQRQLNLWGFTRLSERLSGGNKSHEFSHPHFRRDKPRLDNITRKEQAKDRLPKRTKAVKGGRRKSTRTKRRPYHYLTDDDDSDSEVDMDFEGSSSTGSMLEGLPLASAPSGELFPGPVSDTDLALQLWGDPTFYGYDHDAFEPAASKKCVNATLSTVDGSLADRAHTDDLSFVTKHGRKRGATAS